MAAKQTIYVVTKNGNFMGVEKDETKALGVIRVATNAKGAKKEVCRDGRIGLKGLKNWRVLPIEI